jgi:hypothetical protein
MKILMSMLLFTLAMCYSTPTGAIKKGVTATWSYNNNTESTLGYNLYCSYYPDMLDKRLACNVVDKNATTIICPNVELKTITYFVISAIELNAEGAAEPTYEMPSAVKSITLPNIVNNFAYTSK